MILVLEERTDIADALRSGFEREGSPCLCLPPSTAPEWIAALAKQDAQDIRGILLGQVQDRETLVKTLRNCTPAPVIALADRRSLEDTLALFLCGVSDVVSKPAHARELLMRFRIVSTRPHVTTQKFESDDLVIFSDGRDPLVRGTPLRLPRRERRLLDTLAEARGAWVSKASLFNQVYGVLNEDINECVVESHVSRLRKRLKAMTGRDFIETQRFLGYRLETRGHQTRRALEAADARHGQATHVEVQPECTSQQGDVDDHLWSSGHKRIGYGRAS
jgi:two-component system, OmpR family, flagellar system response regulator FtcR